MKCAKHCTNHGAIHSINLKILNINPKRKESIHFDIFGMKKKKQVPREIYLPDRKCTKSYLT